MITPNPNSTIEWVYATNAHALKLFIVIWGRTMMMDLFRHLRIHTSTKKNKKQDKKFDSKKRIKGEQMSEKDKMDKGFNGKTYTINGIDNDFWHK